MFRIVGRQRRHGGAKTLRLRRDVRSEARRRQGANGQHGAGFRASLAVVARRSSTSTSCGPSPLSNEAAAPAALGRARPDAAPCQPASGLTQARSPGVTAGPEVREAPFMTAEGSTSPGAGRFVAPVRWPRDLGPSRPPRRRHTPACARPLWMRTAWGLLAQLAFLEGGRRTCLCAIRAPAARRICDAPARPAGRTAAARRSAAAGSATWPPEVASATSSTGCGAAATAGQPQQASHVGQRVVSSIRADRPSSASMNGVSSSRVERDALKACRPRKLTDHRRLSGAGAAMPTTCGGCRAIEQFRNGSSPSALRKHAAFPIATAVSIPPRRRFGAPAAEEARRSDATRCDECAGIVLVSRQPAGFEKDVAARQISVAAASVPHHGPAQRQASNRRASPISP